jgi:hypothetical protein
MGRNTRRADRFLSLREHPGQPGLFVFAQSPSLTPTLPSGQCLLCEAGSGP